MYQSIFFFPIISAGLIDDTNFPRNPFLTFIAALLITKPKPPVLQKLVTIIKQFKLCKLSIKSFSLDPINWHLCIKLGMLPFCISTELHRY